MLSITQLLPLVAVISTLNIVAVHARGHERHSALLIIDVQDCFLPGGSLAVNGGDEIVPVINRIRSLYGDRFDLVVLSKDWHCPGHVSFAVSHPNKTFFETVDLSYDKDGELCLGGTVSTQNVPMAKTCSTSNETITLQQELWPVHCVQNVTSGPTSSALDDSLHLESSDVIIYKGTRCELDSYSAFFDNGRFGQTDLDRILKSKGINTVFVTGLALDYCVFFTSIDAMNLGYETYTVTDASRGVAKDTTDAAILKLTNEGIHIIQSDQIGDILNDGNAAPSILGPSVLLLAITLLLTM